MLYKNSIKILFSNFDMVWKILLYYIFVGAMTAGLIYLCVNPVYNILNNSGFFDNLINIYTDFMSSLNLTQLFESFKDVGLEFFDVIGSNISTIWVNFVGLVFVIVFFNVVCLNLAIMPASNSLHYYMGSMNKQGFYSSFRDTFWKSLKFQLIYFIVSLPIKILILMALIALLSLFPMKLIWSVFVILAIILSFIFLTAFKYTLFISWIPTTVVLNYGVWKSLKTSIKNTFRIFKRAYGNSLGVVITILLINMIIGLFTFGFGLLLTVPFSFLLYSTFGMVLTFESQGMRYYVDVYNVITPNKKETSDKINDMKYLV